MKGSNALSNLPKLRVLLVDDEPQRLRGLRSLFSEQVEFIIRDPFEVETEDLLNIDLVSVDEFLGDEWLAATESGEHSSPPRREIAMASPSRRPSEARLERRSRVILSGLP